MLLSLLCSSALPPAATCREIDDGLAITDPKVLKVLDRTYGIGQMIPRVATAEISNKDLFALAVMAPVLDAIKKDIPQEDDKEVPAFAAQYLRYAGSPFNTKYLTTGYARFVLAGIVNRMDRAWAYVDRDPANCGETRFVYRLAYRVELGKKPGTFVDSYLPMTFNLVLRARDPGDAVSCAELAKRWLRLAGRPANATEIADTSRGPLANADPSHVDRLEMNVQSVRWGASAPGKKDFGGRADYILRVFKFDPARNAFAVQALENEVDRSKLLENASLREALKTFLLDPANIAKLDKGTIKIPDEYLTTKGLSVAPGGATRSANRVLSDLLNASDPDVVAAVDMAVASGSLVNIRSAYGFERRLDDISCAGCHQTHSAAGFHFMGIDWRQIYPNNTTQIAGSPHFFADLPRRREIVAAFAEARAPDYARGFAGRPLARHAQELKDTGLYDGWGAHCYRGSDASFISWRSCAQNLTCTVLQESVATPGMGRCLPKGRRQVGDPVERGIVTTSEFDEDTYSRTSPPQIKRPSLKGRNKWMIEYFRRELKLRPNELASHQEFDSTDSTGAFPSGMLRIGLSTSPGTPCPDLTGYPEAICAPVAADGFNSCLDEQQGDFQTCFKRNTTNAGLRRCNKMRPCRDDYLCVATVADNSQDGACLPPYFIFQFRVDGHPTDPPQ
jgi:hypothetical protein